ncbi:MFS transporter [Bacillaceae bacterium SIJ1]|uniref:MFS transporter n=1 Tax=Litoribacterium kuwaitense TaxID=1398745 RepID=UPI0013EA7CD7|nr:MFS transporter [Litoribacterium kuwaitense]NGP46616.1 MFS transporter [Litoribacterium kuwaitense]
MRYIYLVLVIFVLSLSLRPAITSVGPLLDVIQIELGMSSVVASLLTTLPVVCMGIFSLLSIQLSHRFGVEKSLLGAMALICVATLARAVVESSWLFIATSFFSGVGIGIAGPLIAGFVKKYFPHKLSVMSVYSVSMTIGAAVAASFSIPLFNWMNESWSLSLSFWGWLAFAGVLLLIPLLVKGEKKQVKLARPSMRVTNPKVYMLMLLLGSVSAVFYTITAWLAPYVQSIGMSYSQSGFVLMVFASIQIPVSFILPTVVDRWGHRKMWLLICSFSEIIGLIFIFSNGSPWVATVFLGFGAGGLFPLALLIPLAEARSVAEATSWSAQMQFGGFLLGATGPLIFGFILDVSNDYQSAFIGVAVIIAIMLFAIIQTGDLQRSKGSEEAM